MTVLKTETKTAVFSRNTDRVLMIQNRYNTIKYKIEEIPTCSEKLLIRKLVTIFPLIQVYTFISFKLIGHRDRHDVYYSATCGPANSQILFSYAGRSCV